MAKLWRVTNKAGDTDGWGFHCPGCGYGHWFELSRWTFNGDQQRPTFSPSLLVHERAPHPRCHSFVTDGKIQFLSDCGHALAGQTVDLPEMD